MDEFDHALMEALNEAVPPADFTTNLADRLVARTHRRARFWKMFLALGLAATATGAVITATTLSTGSMDVSPIEGDSGRNALVAPEFDWDGGHPDGDSETAPTTLNSHPLNISTTQQGTPTVQNTTLKKAAAITGAIALAAATPTRADGYQFIVSGYPAVNPSHSDVSSGTSLGVGALGDVSAASALEARARAADNSASMPLRSDEYTAMIILFK